MDLVDQACGTNFTSEAAIEETIEAQANMPDKIILEHFIDNVNKLGDRRFMTQPMGGEELKYWSFNETLAEAKKMAGYIESLNLPAKSQIAIMSKNCAWWVIADMAIQMAGHVSVPVYPTLTAETTKFILEHSESKLCFVGKLDEKPWAEMKNGIPSDMPTVSFPLCPADTASSKKWDDVIKSASPIKSVVKRDVDEMCTIIYTSGSTGK
jgi:long-chain acyl-CoA synthetase